MFYMSLSHKDLWIKQVIENYIQVALHYPQVTMNYTQVTTNYTHELLWITNKLHIMTHKLPEKVAWETSKTHTTQENAMHVSCIFKFGLQLESI